MRASSLLQSLSPSRFLLLAALTALMAVFLVGDGVPPAQAQDAPAGGLDPAFATDGTITIDVGYGTSIYATEVLADGKILALGNIGGNFGLTRHVSTGPLDTSFGSNGRITTDFGGNEYGRAMVIQSDGKIVAAGHSGGDFALARYNPDGSLDTSFDSDGKVVTDFSSGTDYAHAVALQRDGKIVAAGKSGNDFALARYNADGTLDTTFDSDGKVTTSVSSGGDIANSVAVQPNGRIVAAGISNGEFAVVRYNRDGSLDTSFDGDGKVTTAIGSGATIWEIALQRDGKIVAAGEGGSNFALARYNRDGTLDTTFGTGGKVSAGFGSGSGGQAVLLQPDGKIVVAGKSRQDGYDNFAVARYNRNGTLDTTFSDDGKVITPLSQRGDTARAVSLQPDGKIVAGGVAGGNFFALARYNRDGTPDGDFGTGTGKVSTDLSTAADHAYGVVVQPDGKIVAAGDSTSGSDFAVVRYNANGTLDTTFGTGGKVTTSLGLISGARAMALQPDGKIVLAGSASDGTNSDFALVRYNHNGTLDRSFSGDGKVTTPVGSGNDAAYAVAVQPDGKFVVAGYSHNGNNNDFALVRYNRNGTLDTSFDGDGKVTTAVSSGADTANAVAVRPNGKIVAAGVANNDFAVVRYNRNGTLDTSFDGDGKVTTAVSSGADTANAVALLPNGKIVAAGISNNAFAIARYNPNGELDTSFGSRGTTRTGFTNGEDIARALLVQAGGELVAVGNTPSHFALARYHEDGTLDAGFGSRGRLTTDFSGRTEKAHAAALLPGGGIVAAGQSDQQHFALARYVAPPRWPALLRITPGPRSLTLTWTKPMGEPTGYDVQYRMAAEDNGNPWRGAAHGGTGHSTTIRGLNNDKTYDLRVRAKNAMGSSGWSAVWQAMPSAVPGGAPTNLVAEAGHNSLRLTWTAPTGTVDYYELQYKPTSRSDWRNAGITGITGGDGWTIWNLSGGTEYHVRVRAVNAIGPAEWSAEARGTPEGSPVSPYAAALGLQANPGDGILVLSWNETSSEITGYDVEYKSPTAPDQTASGGDPDTGWVDAGHEGVERVMTIRGLTNWVPYDVRVRATTANSLGPWVEIQATPEIRGEEGPIPQAVTVTISDTTPEEGDTVTLTATLDQPAPPQGATVQFWAYGNTIGGTVNAATVLYDYTLSPPVPGPSNRFTTDSIRIAPGRTTAEAELEVHHADGDEGTEGIGVHATANVPDADHRYGRRHLTSPTVTMTIYEQGQSPTVMGNQGAPPEQETGVQPTAVTLSLGQTSVSESAGTVTVTATLDAPAPDGGLGGFLLADADGTASADIDFSMPPSIFIPGGQQSATATVTITDDAEDESNETAVMTVMFDLGTSVLEDKITLTITDDDTAGVSITAANPLSVSEGSTATYTVVLDSQPTADVTVAAGSGDVDAATVSPASRVFTATNWNTAQSFTITGVADSDTNDETVGISHSVTSTDTKYANALASTVSVSVSDTTTPPPQQQNRAPTVASAINDATIVNESGTHQVSLSGVFSDADSDSLTVTAASSNTAVATVSVAADYSALTVIARSRGTATITVTANDGNGGTVQDAFTVTVKATPTVASAISDVSGLQAGSTQDVSLSGVFSDADSDSLTITATSSDTGKATVSVASDGSKLTVSGVAQGTATITVTAQDSDGNTVSDTFSVTVVAPPPPAEPNQAPTVASAISDATIVNQSGTHQVSLSGVFSDADSDSLTITASSSDTGKATVSVASDYSSLTVTAKARGTATITVTANDGKGGTVSDTFTVTVKAAPTVASAIGDLRMSSGESQEVSLSGVFSDADSDTLTHSVKVSDSVVVVTYLFDGTLTVVAEADGTATITVTAQDSDGNTVSDAFNVSVVGPPSPATNLSCIAKTDQVAFLWDVPEWSGGDVYAYDLDLTMPDGSSETVRWQGYPAVNKPGTYQVGTEASISVEVVYELADGSRVSSAAAALTCTIQ